MVSVPITTSDHRCALNVRSKTRHALRRIEEATNVE